MKKYLLFLLLSLLLTSCDDSIEGEIQSTMNDFVDALNTKNTDKLIEVTHPSVFEYVTEGELADYYIGGFQRFLKIRGLNKVYGPYEHDDKYYAIGDFKFQKGKVFLKRKVVTAFVFISDDNKEWKIVPFEFDRMGYRFSRFNKDEDIEDVDNYGPVPVEVLEKMRKEYVLGSED